MDRWYWFYASRRSRIPVNKITGYICAIVNLWRNQDHMIQNTNQTMEAKQMTDNTLTIDQTITKGHGPSPDCGQRASIKTIRNHDHQGNPELGYHIVIDCPD